MKYINKYMHMNKLYVCIQSGPRKSLRSSLQPKLTNKMIFVIIVSYTEKFEMFVNKSFFQTTEKVLEVSKKSQKA